jgi:hypothetical protein
MMSRKPDKSRDSHQKRGPDAREAPMLLTNEERMRGERFATISKLNPEGMTGNARRINKQKLVFEGL